MEIIRGVYPANGTFPPKSIAGLIFRDYDPLTFVPQQGQAMKWPAIPWGNRGIQGGWAP